MKIIDSHCDALSKFYHYPEMNFVDEDPRLDCSLSHLLNGDVKIQFFAIFIDPLMNSLHVAQLMKMINIFENKVLSHKKVQLIQNRFDLLHVLESNQIGAILSIEGIDALQGDLSKLQECYNLGVRFIGITWNYRNWAADGILSINDLGFTEQGKKLIKEIDRLNMIVDVSHLSVKSFWELTHLSNRPFIASHSNAQTICGHKRNLSDDQIQMIIQRNGRMGITFVPEFVSDFVNVKIDDLIKHIDYICALGGERHVGIGSDFDGIEKKITCLEHAGMLQNLAEKMLKYYKYSQVECFLFKNWYSFLKQVL